MEVLTRLEELLRYKKKKMQEIVCLTNGVIHLYRLIDNWLVELYENIFL